MSNQCTNPTLEASDAVVDNVRVLEARAVPLGGVRAIKVDRLLPHRTLPTVGAWCFLDRFGPQYDDMTVLPHPHTGLQTVTWPFAGEVRHRDSLGSDALIKPGQLNLMTAGRGISHCPPPPTASPPASNSTPTCRSSPTTGFGRGCSSAPSGT
jgi:redox-sensitive bicupin YhaK (pirin superfamily)